MKKIDFHVHTIKTIKDKDFTFDLNLLKSFIYEKKLDIISITNHNLFDKKQFEFLKENLDVKIFPGMEVDIEGAHLLVIGDENRIDDLVESSNDLSKKIIDENSFITFDDFVNIFKNYEDYILIPHILKKPKMQESTIRKFSGLIKCGEVPNSKKFLKQIKDETKLIPVIFSDYRPDEKFEVPNKYTYIDINEDNFSNIKCAIEDRSKVFINSNKASSEIEYLPDGSTISSKLNIIMGTRTSGKTYNIKKIKDAFDIENCLYIPQFSLIGDAEEEKFENLIEKECSEIADGIYNKFKPMIKKILTFDIQTLEENLENQLDEFKEYANNFNIDEFSKTKIFSESNFYISDGKSSIELINALKTIYINEWNQDLVYQYISKESIKELLLLLIEKRKDEKKKLCLQGYTNDAISRAKALLNKESAANPPDSMDFIGLFKYKKIMNKINDLFIALKHEKEVEQQKLSLFNVNISVKGFENVSELKDVIKTRVPLKESFDFYKQDDLYNYIWDLYNKDFNIDQISSLILKIKYDVKNHLGENPSGGEKAEFNLLKEIKNASKYDVLLIDEPEASFDNPFISDNIVEMIKKIAQKTTVCITTHNSTLAMMLNPDKIIFTENISGTHKVYYGAMGDKVFVSSTGEEIISYDKVLDVLEAGKDVYVEKGRKYASFKNK